MAQIIIGLFAVIGIGGVVIAAIEYGVSESVILAGIAAMAGIAGYTAGHRNTASSDRKLAKKRDRTIPKDS